MANFRTRAKLLCLPQKGRQAKRTSFSNKQRQAAFAVNNLLAIGPGIFLEKADRFRISTEKYI